MRRCCNHMAIIALFFAVSIPSFCTAAPVMVTDRASLGGNSFVDWGLLGPPDTEVASPFIINSSSNGILCRVSNLSEPFLFKTFVQQPPLSILPWNGNFAEGDFVLFTDFLVGPMVIEFNRPVLAAGAQIQMNLLAAFEATLEVFDFHNTLIASYSLPGNSTSAADNSAIFLGVRDSSPTIKRLVYRVVDSVDSSPNDFAVNRLDLLADDVSVPSLTGWGMIVFALLLTAAAFLFTRRRRTV
jgi:hypothetical protein